MNMSQMDIALAVGRHFKRQDRAMHRTGPADIINADQEALVVDLIKIFKTQNPSFNERVFRKDVETSRHLG